MKFVDLVRKIQGEKRIPLYRGETERAYLEEWLEEKREEAPVPDEIGDELSLPEVIENCGRCKNISERKKSFGSGKNNVMIVLNAPGMISRDERELHRSGSVALLKKIVDALPLDFNDCYITNLIKCETSDMLQKPSVMLLECMSIFLRELKEIKPELVLVMGDMLPLQKVINENPGIHWFNIHHPITLIKNSELKRPAWNTLKLVINRLEELGHVC
jgi:uracil-DNA glycosylase family 4